MSTTFANLSVLSQSDEDVLAVLLGDEAFVSPPILGWVTVFERRSDAGDLTRLADLAVRLSGALDTVVIAFLVIELDAFFYLLFRNGELIDEYASDPDFFGDSGDDERSALAGDIDALLPLSVAGTTADRLWAILNEPQRTGTDRALALAELLGIQNAGSGYTDLLDKADGADVSVVGWDLFDHTGDEELEEAEPAPPSHNGHR